MFYIGGARLACLLVDLRLSPPQGPLCIVGREGWREGKKRAGDNGKGKKKNIYVNIHDIAI